ncbi:hypothetical protein E2C01_074717 [Portunus trituberculatus]|uniref:Uncharacterized protein n=1 Tax=Portunus trituberculatus TaxID=210409 RepID=A0A5B7IGZ8_PORTR|nr:hypothetical protein [Portunus trituberculatus]
MMARKKGGGKQQRLSVRGWQSWLHSLNATDSLSNSPETASTVPEPLFLPQSVSVFRRAASKFVFRARNLTWVVFYALLIEGLCQEAANALW